MANTAQAKKRARQAEQSRARNSALRSTARTAVKKVLKAVSDQDAAGAQAAYRAAVSVLDRVAGRGVIPKTQASRYKSRLNARVRHLGA